MSQSAAQQIREAIESADEVFMEASRKGDAAGLAALYTEEGQLMPPNAGFQTGGQAIQAFWQAVVDAGIKEALQPLLDHRQKAAGQKDEKLFKVYEGDDGYLPGEDWESFRIRHKVKTGLAKPKQMPYYLLIVGDPETIPYEFQ